MKSYKMKLEFFFQILKTKNYFVLSNFNKYFKSNKTFFLIILFLNYPSFNSQASGQSNQWMHINTINSNLPGSTIYDITQDKDGFIWVATNNGFAKYIGNYQWLVFHNPKAPFSDVCFCIKAQDSIIWVGTGWGLIRYCNGQMTVYDPSNSSLPDYYIYSLETENNLLWIGTGGYGACKFDGNTFTNYSYSNSGNMPLGNIWSIAIDQFGQKWFSCMDDRPTNTRPGAIVKYDGTSWTLFDTTNSGLQTHPTEISIDVNDNKWISSVGEGLVMYDNVSWSIYDTSTVSSQAFFGFSKVAFDANNNKWLTAQNGFCKYDNLLWTFFDSTNVPFNEIGYSIKIFIDINSNKWIGTISKGILIYNENGVTLTSIDKIEKPSFLNIGSNPSNGNTHVKFNIEKNSNVKIFISDYTGKRLLIIFDEFVKPGIYSIPLNLSMLPSGIYTCIMYSDDSNTSIKLIIIH